MRHKFSLYQYSEKISNYLEEGSFTLVDSDPIALLICKRVLNILYPFASITEFTDHYEAVESLKSVDCNKRIILADCFFAKGQRIDFLELLDEAGIRLPVIVTSCFLDEVEIKLINQSKSVVNFIEKPVTVQKLQAALGVTFKPFAYAV